MADKSIDDFKDAQREKFRVIFRHLLFKWKTSKKSPDEKRRLEDFAKRVGISQPSISSYQNGQKVPTQYNWEAILRVFREDGIIEQDEDPLSFNSDDINDLSRYDRAYIDNIIEKFYTTGMFRYSKTEWKQKIEPFMRFLKTIPAFDLEFPLYCEITHDPSGKAPYVRQYKSKPVIKSSNYSCYQIDRINDALLLRSADIEFILKLRKAVINLISEHFDARSAELDAALNMANWIAESENRKLSQQELMLIDHENMGSLLSDEIENLCIDINNVEKEDD